MSAALFLGDLERSERPGILVGGGAYPAREAINAFAAMHQIPVFRTWNALDVATDDTPTYGGTVGTYGGPGRNFGVQNCDLLLALGCRISGRITGGQPATFARAARRHWVDVDDGLLLEHEWRPHSATQMDAGEYMAQLGESQRRFPDWLSSCSAWVRRYDPVRPEMLAQWHHYGFMRRLSERMPADAIITYDTGGNSIMMGHCFQSKRGQRIFSSNGNTPMGFSMAGAIGAWFAQPTRPIVCIIGDGGMQLNIQELQTIKHYGIPVKIIVLNNGVLGNTKAYQRVNGKPEICCGPDGYSTPDFTAIGRAYGIRTEMIDSWLQADNMIASVLADDEAVLFDVRDMERCTYEPRVSRWDTPIEDMQPFLPRDEFRANLFIEPLTGWENNK